MESLQPLDPGLTDASILAGLHANSPPSEPDSRAAVNAIAAQFHSNPDVDDEWVEESPSTARPTSADEKRTRQRELNRQAADKSRRKRRAELSVTESQVTLMTQENVELRAKLSALRAARGESADDIASTPVDTAINAVNALNTSAGIDYAYIGKLQAELVKAKTVMLDRELDLLDLTGEPSRPDLIHPRRLLLEHLTTLSCLQDEAKSLQRMVDYLHGERDKLLRLQGTARKALNGEFGESAGMDQDLEIDPALTEQQPEGAADDKINPLTDLKGWLAAAMGTFGDHINGIPDPLEGREGSGQGTHVA